jgi:hypothetical protein
MERGGAVLTLYKRENLLQDTVLCLCRNILLDCIFARTHHIAKNGKFDTFTSKPVISIKSVELSAAVCSGKCVTKL